MPCYHDICTQMANHNCFFFFFFVDVPALASVLLEHPEPYRPFLPLLRHSTNAEDPIPLLASTFLTKIVSTSLVSSSKPAARDEEALPQLNTYLSTLTKNQDSGLQDIGVQECSTLLRNQRSRQIFWSQRAETVGPLVEILRSAAGAKDNGSTLASSSRAIEPGLAGGVGLQLLYRVLLVIWQLSFEGSLVGDDLQAYVARIIHGKLLLIDLGTTRSFNSTPTFYDYPPRKRRLDSSLRRFITSSPPTVPLYCPSQYSSAFPLSSPTWVVAT